MTACKGEIWRTEKRRVALAKESAGLRKESDRMHREIINDARKEAAQTENTQRR